MIIKDIGKFAAGMALVEKNEKDQKENSDFKNLQEKEYNKQQYEYLAVTKGLI